MVKAPTKKQKAQLDQKIELDDEEDEIAEHKPTKAKERKREETETDKEELQKALKDLLIRLGSRDIDDLKQMTFMSLKIRDPLAKGMAYYDSTFRTIETQCSELLDWYIAKCEADIADCKAYIKKTEDDAKELEMVNKELSIVANTIIEKVNKNEATPEEMAELSNRLDALKEKSKKLSVQTTSPTMTLKKKTLWEKIFGVKIVTSPELEVFNANKRLEELEARLADLNKKKAETEEVDVDGMYFKKWAYNYLLNCRSQLGEDNFLKMMVMLTDGQIVNKQESGSVDMSKVFAR